MELTPRALETLDRIIATAAPGTHHTINFVRYTEPEEVARAARFKAEVEARLGPGWKTAWSDRWECLVVTREH